MIDRETIIKNANEVHNGKYIYDNITDINNVNVKIHIVCPIHGDFYQTYWNHVHLKKGCKQCGFIRSRQATLLKKEEFIERASLTHSDIDKYDFSGLNLEERDDKKRITIKCKEHGDFNMRPSHFMEGYGCPYCGGYSRKDEDVRKELSKIHKDLDFSISKYSERDENYRIKVFCPTHGIRNLNYFNLKRGQGCDLCRYKKIGMKQRISYDVFIQRAENMFGKGTYIYSKDIMKNREEDGKITVTCPIHGDFKVLIHNFLTKHSGCPICKQSHLEEEVRLFLIDNNIDFIQEKTFDWLRNINPLFLDFYLPQYNVAIECQGGQHFTSVEYFGGQENFEIVEYRDDLKNKLCNEHNIKILYYAHCNCPYRYKLINSLKELKEAILN